MTSETKKTIIRHLKGIVAALENEENIESKGDWRETYRLNIERMLDSEWDDNGQKIMLVRKLKQESKEILKKIALERGLNIKIEEERVIFKK